MNILLTILKITTIFLLTYPCFTSALYEFVFDNDEIFSTCPDLKNSKGIHEIFDLSDMIIEFDDGNLHCEGNVTVIWNDVEEDDIVKVRIEVFKFQRGTWQPTVYTIASNNICKDLYTSNTIWFHWWSSNIDENDRVCFNKKGRIFHHQAFDVNNKFEMTVGNIEGRYRIVVAVSAFDTTNKKERSKICFEIIGEVAKIMG